MLLFSSNYDEILEFKNYTKLFEKWHMQEKILLKNKRSYPYHSIFCFPSSFHSQGVDTVRRRSGQHSHDKFKKQTYDKKNKKKQSEVKKIIQN